MKKIILLFTLIAFSCSSGGGDSDDSNNNSNNPDDPIIGTWLLVNEEILSGDHSNSCRGCFMDGDEGERDIFTFTESQWTKVVWECFPENGSLCSGQETYSGNWINIGPNIYSTDGESFEVNFTGNDQMQTPFEDGEILQTWERVN